MHLPKAPSWCEKPPRMDLQGEGTRDHLSVLSLRTAASALTRCARGACGVATASVDPGGGQRASEDSYVRIAAGQKHPN
ncbi:hypothetical protein AV530_015335 [Patagioenas fasciata monilis]|uniref:Uncharacterized protein n=1 Tax=Patagioenas fasciata monilis TaxID=372326 RepID=A0A1V4JZT3_PATFA|nr:hypothetical protein AV530_015335 [Patagioenas fasciata monilis]